VDLIHLARDISQGADFCENDIEPTRFVKFDEAISLSRKTVLRGVS
jgi:hypothetical protein